MENVCSSVGPDICKVLICIVESCFSREQVFARAFCDIRMPGHFVTYFDFLSKSAILPFIDLDDHVPYDGTFV